jgi:hypothetical protein
MLLVDMICMAMPASGVQMSGVITTKELPQMLGFGIQVRIKERRI